MIQRILAPLDGSPQAEGVLPYVGAIAGAMRSEVTILHAIGGSRVVTGRRTRQARQRAYVEQLQAKSQRLAKSYLETQAKRLQDQGVPVQISVEYGQPSEVIVGYGGAHKPDLIAICTHSRSDLSTGTLGSVASHLLHNARSPLLLVRPQSDASGTVAPIKNIVVPLDTSELAEGVLPIAQELAGAMNLTITLVLAMPTLSQLYLGPELVAHPSEIIERSEGEAAEYLQELCGRLESEGLSVDWRVMHGDPARTIVEYAGQSRANLIAMATHGRSGLGRWVLGSVTDNVVRTGESPVMVVRPSKS